MNACTKIYNATMEAKDSENIDNNNKLSIIVYYTNRYICEKLIYKMI